MKRAAPAPDLRDLSPQLARLLAAIFAMLRVLAARRFDKKPPESPVGWDALERPDTDPTPITKPKTPILPNASPRALLSPCSLTPSSPTKPNKPPAPD